LQVDPIRGYCVISSTNTTMTTTTLAIIITLLLLPIIILLWATESKDQRITRQVRACMKKGYSQRQTAAALGLTRYRVRKAIAA